MIQAIKLINLGVAFLLELAMLAALGYWGYQQGKKTMMKYAFAIGLPVIAMVLWGIFAAPKSQYRLDTPARVIFEVSLYTITAFLLYKSGHTTLATVCWFIMLLSQLIAVVGHQ
jgi:hypothetical protein